MLVRDLQPAGGPHSPVEEEELELLQRQDVRFECREHFHWLLVVSVEYCEGVQVEPL